MGEDQWQLPVGDGKYGDSTRAYSSVLNFTPQQLLKAFVLISCLGRTRMRRKLPSSGCYVRKVERLEALCHARNRNINRQCYIFMSNSKAEACQSLFVCGMQKENTAKEFDSGDPKMGKVYKKYILWRWIQLYKEHTRLCNNRLDFVETNLIL